jgi:anti-sigma factor RsiW
MAGLNEREREEISAFLDGELDAKRARAVEARINVDPTARAEADALRRTSELLDFLPKPEPSATFTSRTLERLAVPLTQKAPAVRPRWRRWALGLAWAAAVLLAAAGGFALAGRLWRPPEPAPVAVQETPDVDGTLERHLRVIRNQKLYELADDLETLRALDQPDLFGDDHDS